MRTYLVKVVTATGVTTYPAVHAGGAEAIQHAMAMFPAPAPWALSPCVPTPLDELLAALSAQDHHRSQVLRAIERQAACTARPSASLQNYFQGEAAQLRRRR